MIYEALGRALAEMEPQPVNVNSCRSPADAEIMGQVEQLTRTHWAWKKHGTQEPVSSPQPPPTGTGEPMTIMCDVCKGEGRIHTAPQHPFDDRNFYKCPYCRDGMRHAPSTPAYARTKWQQAVETAKAQGLDVTDELDQMARALSAMQEGKQ